MSKDLKELVKEKYSKIAVQSKDRIKGACGDVKYACDADNYSVLSDTRYGEQAGYTVEADLGLGCGLPTEFAKIKEGDTVVDLGSGAGNDCFIARAETGATGRVIGIDFVDAMLLKAWQNVNKLGYNNVSFLIGDIENIPLPDMTTDVVVSNCVMNLVPNKVKAFSETYRILKEGGHFSISDIVVEGNIPKELKEEAEAYAGCVSGALDLNEYLNIIKNAGFKDLTIQKKKAIDIPHEILSKHLIGDDLTSFSNRHGIFSITLYATK